MEGFIYHIDTCNGCGACQIACQDSHLLQPYEYFRRVLYIEKIHHYISIACMHCIDAKCVQVCPTGAMYEEDGFILHHKELCIGCGKCMSSCDYGAISLSKKHGYAQKCDGCITQRKNGKQPGCVAACPTRSIEFGEIDPEKTYNKNTRLEIRGEINGKL